jgi:hypothetical protein
MDDSLRKKFAEVFAAKWYEENYPQYSDMLDKFVFHMSDAARDVRELADALEIADAIDCGTLGKLLHKFLLHALPQLVSAGQLYDFVPDIFPEQRGVHGFPDAGGNQSEKRGNS